MNLQLTYAGAKLMEKLNTRYMCVTTKVEPKTTKGMSFRVGYCRLQIDDVSWFEANK